jgi:hypothetical protein
MLVLPYFKALHWMVMHPEDIAMSNFLAGEMKQFFENLEVCVSIDSVVFSSLKNTFLGI